MCVYIYNVLFIYLVHNTRMCLEVALYLSDCSLSLFPLFTIIKAPMRWHCVTLQVQAYVQS